MSFKENKPLCTRILGCEISGEKLHKHLFDERGGERKLNPSNDSGFKFKRVYPPPPSLSSQLLPNPISQAKNYFNFPHHVGDG